MKAKEERKEEKKRIRNRLRGETARGYWQSVSCASLVGNNESQLR